MIASYKTKKPESAKHFAARCKVHYKRWGAVAMGITNNLADAEEIVQQAITIAIEKGGHFESDENFSAWVCQIVRNCALNRHRKTKRRKTYSVDPTTIKVPVTSEETTYPVDDSTGELMKMQRSFDDSVQSALNQLSSDARCCLLLRVVQQLSYREIAETLNMKEGTAMNLVHRSKNKMRLLLNGATNGTPA